MRTDSYQYQPEHLKALQQVELNMLKKLDIICRKYHIPYFLVWGSMLGAVRHKGIIPWDDDIDVGMLREDYERLRNVPKEEWDGDYILVDPKDNDCMHRRPHPQLKKANSIFETKYHIDHNVIKNKKEKDRMPIWLDIFLFDHVSFKKPSKIRWGLVLLLSKLYYYAKCKIIPVKDDSISYKLLCWTKSFIHSILNLAKSPELIICKKIERICKYSPGENIAVFYTTSPKHMTPCRYDSMFPLCEVDFEDMKTFIPKNYDYMMRARYGNQYMNIPNEDKRINHAPYILNFGDGEPDVINRQR